MFGPLVRPAIVLAGLFLCAVAAQADPIPIENHSFEIPVIDPNENPLMAVPVAPYWIELDLDPEYSANTGTFLNPPPESPAGDHIVNADGRQLAFLGSQEGNGFLQTLSATYQAGKWYRLSVDICPSMRYPPKTTEPIDTLTLGFYAGTDPNDIVTAVVPATELTMNVLKTFQVELPPVQADDPWAGKSIGISIRAMGTPGAYWDLDNVCLTEFPLRPDFTGDSFVNLEDFAMLAADWLLCGETMTDLTGEGCVNMEDLFIFMDTWLGDV